MGLMRLRILLFILGLVSSLTTNTHAQKFTASSAPELDNLFQQTNGWVGADGAFSVPLSKNKSVWLYSDTWIGKVNEGKRVDVSMINNTIAIQRHGKRPEFYYPTNEQGKAQSFIKPADGRGFFWLFHGTRTKAGLFFFLRQLEIVDKNSVFGFKGFSSSIAHVKNPDDHPAKWQIEQTKFPFEKHSKEEQVVMGAALMKRHGYIYIYGNHSGPEKSKKGMIVARVHEKQFGVFDQWQFFSNGNWVKDFNSVTPICIDAPSEASVSYWPKLKKYVFVYIQGFWGKVVIRTSDQPTGPWSEPIPIYDAPEMKYPSKVFAYAGKAHPELSASKDELIVTYAANSFNFVEVIQDARLYWPRFVRVKIEK